MVKTNVGLVHLSNIKPFRIDLFSLPSEQNAKIRSTAKYSLKDNPNQDEEEVINRCRRAIPAEYAIADYMDGYVNNQPVRDDHSDPYEWAWDVLAHPRFSGLRIEVKTHFMRDPAKHSPWINMTTGVDGMFPDGSGINLGPLFKHGVADCIIILIAKYLGQGVMEYTPTFVGDAEDLANKVRKSHKGAGGYLMI